MILSGRRPLIHWFSVYGDSTGVSKVCVNICFLRGIYLRPWWFSLASLCDPQFLCAAKPRVHSTMLNARGWAFTVGRHLTPKQESARHSSTSTQSTPKNMFLFQINFDDDILDMNQMNWSWTLGYFSDTWGRGETSSFLECRGEI